ncbi:Hypothetical predicted protein [Mytilus galloprovincialis]|uniref:Uncharacterized protein n=1 Tax=Mytilus galloprovincialis TaxID=29158 RepID=A0A8B6C0A1_MYTGA|nr:Hypothetical predicted protein [Mytilus galloprovincialis]
MEARLLNCKKGSIGINNASIERRDTIITRTGQRVHLHCQRSYVNPIVIKGLNRKSTSSAPLATPPKLRSQKQFSFQEDCLFCELICIERKDEWATEVKGRIEFARDLHAVDALYHSSCNTNFRTGKNVPQLFSPKSDKSQIKRGRPNTNDQHFLKVLDFLEDNDDEQLTIKDLVDRMKALCGDEAYSQPYMKQKVQEHYGSSILITELNGKPNVVTFRQTASTIIHNFYKESQLKKSDEDSKLFLLKTAAALIKSEIRSMPVDKNYYPSNNDILSHEKHIPESLAVFLNILFSEKDASLKISSIGQAIMQATRPRLVIEPLQLGLAIQMHHMFGSRFLVDTLSNMGFCSSYSEVQKFETSAVISKQENTSNHYDESHCLQYMADNVDHNLCTVDGNNTFHGMGIISCITPGNRKKHLFTFLG